MFPTPRRSDLSGGRAALDVVGTSIDGGLPAQGYRLTIDADGTRIDHADEAGLRYALDTVEQLRADEPVGTGVVEDWPDFTERAYMLDVSRDRVPTMETLGWLVDLLGRLRYTELQLYTEHTFAWPDHEIVWRDASPFTPEELATVDGWCRAAGLRLTPCLNGFGHMERFLRHEAYRHRAECPDGAPGIFGGITPPTTLAPTPDNAAFSIALYREYLEALPSTRLHAGGDEPFELGHGRSAGSVAARGRAAVYAEHLRRIVQPFTDDGLEVLFWGDVLSREPDLVAGLPEGATAVAWWYAPPRQDPPAISQLFGPEIAARLGMPEDALLGFTAHTRAFAETDLPFWVAPGTSSWNSLIGRWPDAAANIDDAVAVGADLGTRGVLLTDWGDGGHHQPMAVSLLPLVHAAGAAWCRATHDPAAVPRQVDVLVAAPGAGEALARLGAIDDLLGIRQFNASAVNNALFGTFVPGRRRGHAEAFAAAEEMLDAAGRTAIPDLAPPLADGVIAASRLARNGLWRLADALDHPAPARELVDDDLRECIELHGSAWLETSRLGGLVDSLARLEARLAT